MEESYRETEVGRTAARLTGVGRRDLVSSLLRERGSQPDQRRRPWRRRTGRWLVAMGCALQACSCPPVPLPTAARGR